MINDGKAMRGLCAHEGVWVRFYGWFGFALRAGAKRDFVGFWKVYSGNGKGLEVNGVKEEREK